MTGFDAVNKVYDELSLLTLSLQGGIYQFAKPATIEEPEFIVINVLPVPETVLQKTHVNLNIFVQDVAPGTPDNGRLSELLNEVYSQFPFGKAGDDIQVFKERTAIIEDGDYERHYVNVRLTVLSLNN